MPRPARTRTVKMCLLLLLLGAGFTLRPSAPRLQPLRSGKQRRCRGPEAAEPLGDAASLEAFAAASRAAALASRNPAEVSRRRQAANAEVAQLQSSGDGQLAELLLEERTVGRSGELSAFLRKRTGTISIVAEGVPIDSGGSSCLDSDLADAAWLSEQFRLGGAAAVCASTRLSATAVADTVREQQSDLGNFPGPLPVVVRADFVHPLQLARAARDGAQAVLLPLDLAGADATRELLACAHRLGLGTIVRVADDAGLEAALRIGAAAVAIGDVGLEEADALRAQLPPEILSVCDVRLRDVVDVWTARDAGFDALIVGEMLLRSCARERRGPAPLIQAMLAKGSVGFGGGTGKVVSGGRSAYGPSMPSSIPTFRPINKL